MFKDSVAQNPTIAVSCGMNTRQNSPPDWNLDFWLNSADASPTFTIAHTISASPDAIRNGAVQDSSHLIELIPFQMKYTLMSQNARKHAICHGVSPSIVRCAARSAARSTHPSPPSTW